MAWRPSKYLLEGELDNTTPGKVTGWMRFAGLKEKVNFDLEGDSHRDIRGAKIRLSGNYRGSNTAAVDNMEGFAEHQTGKAGDITAGLPPKDYVDYPYIEWYSDDNGRVVLELEQGQVEVIGTPIPPEQQAPISRQQQWDNLAGFAVGIGSALTAQAAKPEHGLSATPARRKGLLTDGIRKQLPPLYAQEKLGPRAIAYARFFMPDGSWIWHATEFDGRDTFFGLVDGHFKELGYFSLAELQQVRGALGLPVERDLYFKPTPLNQIAPELFAAAAAAKNE